MRTTHKLSDALIMLHTQKQTKRGWLQTYVIPHSSVKVLQICTPSPQKDQTMCCLSCYFNRKTFKNGQCYGEIDGEHFVVH
ncbi:hypothetical protein [Motilimonas sp. KMU-193]|uniref:hypothetical protein n=1 Tax=Motilimonas sp. KMU-193 TaxID=3388668 RepID=UPI00396AEFD7